MVSSSSFSALTADKTYFLFLRNARFSLDRSIPSFSSVSIGDFEQLNVPGLKLRL